MPLSTLAGRLGPPRRPDRCPPLPDLLAMRPEGPAVSPGALLFVPKGVSTSDPRCTSSPLGSRPRQGSWSPAQLDLYLDKFTFRYNRRRSKLRDNVLFYRLIENAVITDPQPYNELVA